MPAATVTTAAGRVSAIWLPAAEPRAVLVAGHGAGGGMRAPLLERFCRGLAELGISTLRFNFPYRERGAKAPDRPPVLIETSRAAFAAAGRRAGGLPVWAGGRSMGGRIASMAVAEGMPAAGLVFLAYPMHPPGRPDRVRDEHLYGIEVPMLFIQGTRDPFATAPVVEPVLRRLGERATVAPVEGGDHAFAVAGGERDAGRIGTSLAPVAARFMLADR
jgi:predicted alpha/beta-hydrolase family hydrolase